MASLTSQLLVRLIDGISKPARAASNAIKGIGGSFKGLNGLQSRVGAAMERNAVALDAARGRMIDAAASAYILQRALAAPIGAAIRFESAMADVAKVSGLDDAGLNRYGRELRKLAVNEIPMAVEELAALSAAAAQSGVADDELLEFTRLTAQAAVAWEMNGAAAGESLAKIKTQLSLTTSETALFAAAINHLSDNSAASAGDLVDYARRVSATGEFFGFAKEQTLAFGAAMVGAGFEAEVAATSFRNMGRALTRGASATKRQSAAFETLGLDAVKVAKQMQQDAVGTTIEVIERLGKLPAEMRASVMSDLFGDEARGLAPLLNDIEQLRKVLGLVADETQYASSVTDEFARRAATTEYAWQRFKSQMNDVALSIGGALLPALREIMAVLGPMVLRFAEFAEANPRLVATLIGLATALISLTIASAAARYAFLLLKGGLLQMAYGAIVASKAFAGAGLAAAMTRIAGIAQIAGLRFRLMGRDFRAGLIGVGGLAKGTFATVARGLLSLLNPMALVRGSLVLLKAAVIGTGIGAILVGIAMAGAWIYNNWSGIKEMFAGIAEGIRNAFPGAAAAIDTVSAAATALFGWLGDVAGAVDASPAQWRAFGVSIGESIGGVIATLAAFPGKAYEAISAAAVSFYNAGSKMIQDLWDGAVAKFNEFIEWVKTIPQRIIAAIGNIDLRNIIKWPSLPGWLGGSGAPATSAAGRSISDTEIPARAKGGPLAAGQPTLVGEEGPEIVTSSRSGYVHPNSALGGGGGITVNVREIIVQEAANGRRVAAELRKEIEFALRGIQADYGLTTS